MNRRRLPLLVVATALALTAANGCQGCFGCAPPTKDPGTSLPGRCQTDPPLIEAQRLDILFVIDDSGSMREEQEAVARELTAFIDEIRRAGGVRQDFNVGVLNTSVYQHSALPGYPPTYRSYPAAGRLRPVPDLLPDGGLERETSNPRVLSGSDPDLIEKFARLVRQGTFGSGQETPFEAVRLALLGPLASAPLDQGGNQGFLRDGARLLVVVLTDEDDCSETVRPPRVTVGDNSAVADCTVKAASLTTVSEYHRLFSQELSDGLGTRREIIWTAIAPVGRSTKQVQEVLDRLDGGAQQVRNIDCPTSIQAGFRHRQMAEMFDSTLANLDSICRDSFRETLVHIAELASVNQTLELTRVPDPALLKLTITRADGTQQACTVLNNGIEVVDPGGPGKATKVRFQNQGDTVCRRRADDRAVEVLLLCVT